MKVENQIQVIFFKGQNKKWHIKDHDTCQKGIYQLKCKENSIALWPMHDTEFNLLLFLDNSGREVDSQDLCTKCRQHYLRRMRLTDESRKDMKLP